jgi:hypothetical protein
MTGPEFREARLAIGRKLDRRISWSEMARLCGLSDAEGNGKGTIRKWEAEDGPTGPVAAFVGLLLDGLDAHLDVANFFCVYIVHTLEEMES